jgi:hypothetical protein
VPSRIPHFVYNRFTVGGDLVSLMRRPEFVRLALRPAGRFVVLIAVRDESTPGRSAAGKITSIGKSSDIGNRIRYLPTCSLVPRRSEGRKVCYERRAVG